MTAPDGGSAGVPPPTLPGEGPPEYSIEDPFSHHAWMRKHRPVSRDEKHGFWLLTRYRDVQSAARDHGAFSSRGGVMNPQSTLFRRSLITHDPPTHTRMRALVSKAFTPAVIGKLEPRIQGIADELLDRVIGRGSFDLAGEFALPLTLIVVAELLGVDRDRRGEFVSWTAGITRRFGVSVDEESRKEVATSIAAFDAFVAEAVERRRACPTSDVLSGLVHATVDGERLSDEDLAGFCMLLLVAGHITTAGLITSGMVTLLQNPQPLRRACEDPQLVGRLVEELLRFESPVQGFFRTTTREVTLSDVVIPAGDKVLLSFAAANRDEEVFPEPDRFDIDRLNANEHLAFGKGIHFCIGAALGRMEAAVAFSTLLRRLPSLELDGRGERHRTELLRGFARLPIRFRAQ